MPRTVIPSALGACQLTWQGEVVTGFKLPEDSDSEANAMNGDSPPAWVSALAERVRRHLQGTCEDFSDVPCDFSLVSNFRQRVYRETRRIRTGETCSYGALASALGLPASSSRAVGGALGSNPWPLLVPCHRVIGTDGRMTGFSASGGIRTKRRLLAIEGCLLLAD